MDATDCIRYDELARRLVLSPRSERGMTEEASSYPAEVFTEGLRLGVIRLYCRAIIISCGRSHSGQNFRQVRVQFGWT
jgi:hypothetical protein